MFRFFRRRRQPRDEAEQALSAWAIQNLIQRVHDLERHVAKYEEEMTDRKDDVADLYLEVNALRKSAFMQEQELIALKATLALYDVVPFDAGER